MCNHDSVSRSLHILSLSIFLGVQFNNGSSAEKIEAGSEEAEVDCSKQTAGKGAV